MTAFTENQIKAMNERDCNLLVSASAGSGKTTVLISRVVNLILGKDTTPDGGRVDYKGEKASLDNMVICTYTRAAAADMRDKLQTALIAEEEKGNIILMQAAGTNVAGQVASVIAGGLVISIVSQYL